MGRYPIQAPLISPQEHAEERQAGFFMVISKTTAGPFQVELQNTSYYSDCEAKAHPFNLDS